MNKTTKNKKIGKGLVSLTTIIAILISVLAGNIYYEKNITANVIKELADSEPSIPIKEVDDIQDLSQLNEGWYEIRNGYVFYLEHFDYAVPLYIKVKNPEQQNGMVVVDENGNIDFFEEENSQLTQNQISGNAAGMERVSGFDTVTLKPDQVTVGKSMATGTSASGAALTTTKTYVVDIGNQQYKIIIAEPSSTMTNLKVYDGKAIIDKTGQITNYQYEKDSPTLEKSVSNSEALKGSILQNWAGESLNNLPIQGGSRDISGCISTSFCNYKNTYFLTDGKTATRTVETTLKADNTKQVVTISNINAKPVKTEVWTFSDGATKTMNYKKDSDMLDKVTYKTKDGSKTLELSGKDYKNLQLPDNDKDRILSFAAKEGFKTVKLNEQGMLEEGNKKIQLAQDDIYLLDGERVTKQITNDNKEIAYSGDAKLIDGQIVLGNGASQKIYEKDADGQLRLSHYEIVDSGGLSRTVVTYNQDGSFSVLVSKRGSIGEGRQAPLKFLIKEPINDPESSFYRMYKFEMDGQDYYYDEEATIRGTGIRIYRDENRQKVEVTDFTNEQKENLKASIGIISETKGITTPLQLKSQQFFANVERIFTEFRGLGYYATLFFDEDSLLAWRDNVDRGFATLYLGAEYWSSAICSNYLDGEDEGIAYAETPQGLAQVGAHIEATRTEPIINETSGRIFIYKITFNVRNGDYGKDPRAPEEMNINVVLKGEKTAKVFKQDIKIKRGSSFGKTGSNAIVQDSPTLFTKVCLTFDDVPLRWKLDDDDLCNTIVESSGAPTPLTKTTQPPTAASGTGPQAPGVNDF